jgi:hypothetical protein
VSLKDFCDQVERHISTAARLGSRICAIIVCPSGEQGIMEENVKSPCGEVDIMPEIRIHGVPVRVHKRMRPGRFFYVMKEEK